MALLNMIAKYGKIWLQFWIAKYNCKFWIGNMFTRTNVWKHVHERKRFVKILSTHIDMSTHIPLFLLAIPTYRHISPSSSTPYRHISLLFLHPISTRIDISTHIPLLPPPHIDIYPAIIMDYFHRIICIGLFSFDYLYRIICIGLFA
jgi:hypothetical protein